MTLIELAIAIAVFGIAASSVMYATLVGVRSSGDPMEERQAMSLAESLLDEATSKAFTKPSGGFAGPYTQVNRALFDTVSDYSGVSLSPVSTLDGGAPPSSISGYSAVFVVDSTTMGAPVALPSKTVTVTVTTPRGKTFSLSGYRIDYEN